MVSPIKKGSVLQNNDARYEGATVVVEEVFYEVPGNPLTGIDYVRYYTGTRRATIKGERIFTDGKKRPYGYNFVR